MVSFLSSGFSCLYSLSVLTAFQLSIVIVSFAKIKMLAILVDWAYEP